ncbi:MAG: thiamine-phosphate kinase [Phycisphaerales bacterium JB050]
MRESAFHEHVRARSAGTPGVVVGPGDDCAVLDTGAPELQLITTDQLIAGRHYDPATTPVELIARKALARSVSDIAAMCGRPVASVCTASFAGDDSGMATELFDAMAALGERWGAPLVGGDFASGSATQFTTTVIGAVQRETPGPILRGGAKIGDAVWVTGSIGNSYESGHHLHFTPRFAEGLELRDRLGEALHAAIDISDGLGRDAGRIARMSGVRIAIDADRVPLRDPSRPVERSIADGEDYELLFVTTGEAQLPPTLEGGTTLTRIGTVVEGEGAVLRFANGRSINASESGWDHGG